MMLATGLMLLAGIGKPRLELRPPEAADGDDGATAVHGERQRGSPRLDDLGRAPGDCFELDVSPRRSRQGRIEGGESSLIPARRSWRPTIARAASSRRHMQHEPRLCTRGSGMAHEHGAPAESQPRSMNERWAMRTAVCVA